MPPPHVGGPAHVCERNPGLSGSPGTAPEEAGPNSVLLSTQVVVSQSLLLIGTGQCGPWSPQVYRAYTLCSLDVPIFKLLLGLTGSLESTAAA